MSEPREAIGFLPCKKCQSLKSVFQGQGKRARFLYLKCGCGIDQRTGQAIQNEFSQHITKEEAQAALKSLTEPKPPEAKPEEKEDGIGFWGVAGLVGLGLFGVLKVVRG